MITEFRGQYRFLSNFYPTKVFLDGEEYLTVEHAYQAAKCLLKSSRRFIQRATTPGKAKRIGRQMELRHDWEQVKLSIMEDLLRQKFSQEPLRSQLKNTVGQRLEEGNWWGDTFWGICNGQGENHLGRILMDIREEAD